MDDVPARTRRAALRKQRILLNVQPELGDWLRDLAARERRPLSTQIELLLERVRGDDTQETGVPV